MNLNEYQEAAKTTRTYDALVLYPSLGLIGESGEFMEKYLSFTEDKPFAFSPNFSVEIEDVIAEMGDILWYISSICTDFDVRLEEIYDSSIRRNLTKARTCLYTEVFLMTTCSLAEKIKKTIRDNNSDFSIKKKEILGIAGLVLGHIDYYCYTISSPDREVTLEEVCEKNIKKLSSRKERNKIHGEGDNR